MASESEIARHRSLVITEPVISDAGNYTCQVQTFGGTLAMFCGEFAIYEEIPVNLFSDQNPLVELLIWK